MEYLGKVEEITSDGRLIVQCSGLPEIGSQVYDRRQSRMGTVKRVFGPVDGPYASIRPVLEVDVTRMKGVELYFKGENQNGKGKRRNRRD